MEDFMKNVRPWFPISLELLLKALQGKNDVAKGRLIQKVCKDAQTLTYKELSQKYDFVFGRP
jgi:hypothetical protein